LRFANNNLDDISKEVDKQKHQGTDDNAKWLLALEAVVLLVITFHFWYPAPPRDQFLWLLVMLLPIYAAHLLLYRRFGTGTLLDGLFIGLIALCLVNVTQAPYTRGYVMLGRPLHGMALVVFCAEYARVFRKVDVLVAATTGFSLLVGVMSLVSTQWVSKSDELDFITKSLPTIDLLPGAFTTFNPNEIGGALAYLCPLLAGIALYRWREGLPRIGVTLAFALMFAGMLLGQSRLAIGGVLVMLLILPFLLIPTPKWRWLVVGGVLIVSALEMALVFNLFPRAAVISGGQASGEGLSQRDENSIEQRLALWGSGLAIIRDYPWTGVGMAMYRDWRVRERYPGPRLMQSPPHAHNEWIQVGTDLGVPGLTVYAAWHVVIASMLWHSWRRGDGWTRALVAAIAGGLLAHMVYGIGDAITLWDRFAFVHFWLLGLAVATYIMAETSISLINRNETVNFVNT
jgi:hypothetical protein